MKLQGAIFDVDGTLLDSMFIWDTIGETYLRSLGITPRENLNQTFKNMSLYQAARHYQDEYGVSLSTDQIMAGVNQMIERYYREEAPAKPGAAKFLAALQRRGVRMCVATATDRHLVEAAFARLGILHCFLDIFTCTLIGHGKDQPHIFEAALERLNLPRSEVLVFEDALYAARTVKAAGFPLAAVYDEHEPNQRALRALADYYVEDFSQAEGFVS